MKSKLKRIAALLAALLVLTSCGGKTADYEKSENTRAFTDSAGRTVYVPEEITRVAVSGPMAQIVVFSAAPDKLVALAGDWSEDAGQYIDEKYYNLPILGQLFGGTKALNMEQLAKAAPQVVIDVGESKEGIAQELDSMQEQVGIPFVHISASLETMDETYRQIGELLNVQDYAGTLGDYCRRVYDRTVEIMEQVGDDKVTALYCMGDLGCNVICTGTYHSQVLDLVTENLAQSDSPSSKGTGNEVDIEQIYLWNPEVIFFAPNSIYEYAADDPEWQELDAIKNGRYYETPYGVYNWMGFPPSVQRFLGMSWMTSILYPEQADYDLYEEVREFYSLFFHCELTQAQYEALVANSVGKAAVK